MIAATFPCDRKTRIADRRPSISDNDGPQELARWGRILYWTGLIFAVLIFGMAIMFAMVDNRESLFQRAASVIVLGVIPALMIWAGGYIIFMILRATSAVYDWTATALRRSSSPKN